MNFILEITKNLEFANSIWGFALPMILIALDVLLGVIGAISNKNFQSAKMRHGLSKKVGEVVILVVGELFCMAFRLPSYIMTFFSFYIILMEITSLIENLGKLGVPVPKFISSSVSDANNALSNEEYDVLVKRIEELEEKEKGEDK